MAFVLVAVFQGTAIIEGKAGEVGFTDLPTGPRPVRHADDGHGSRGDLSCVEIFRIRSYVLKTRWTVVGPNEPTNWGGKTCD